MPLRVLALDSLTGRKSGRRLDVTRQCVGCEALRGHETRCPIETDPDVPGDASRIDARFDFLAQRPRLTCPAARISGTARHPPLSDAVLADDGGRRHPRK